MTPCAKLTKIHQKAAPRERLGWYLQKTGEVFEHRENLLRLLVVMVMSNEAAEPEAMQTVIEVRNEGRNYMRTGCAGNRR